MGTYVTVSHLSARIPYRTISGATSPSTTQVDYWIEESEAILHGALAAAGYSGPFDGTDQINILRSWCLDYVEGRFRMAYAAAGGDGRNDDGKDLIKRFEDRLDWIRANPSATGAVLGAEEDSSTSADVPRSFWTSKAEGKGLTPTFKKGDVL